MMGTRRDAFFPLVRFFDLGMSAESGPALDEDQAAALERQARPGGWINRMLLAAALLLIICNAIGLLLLVRDEASPDLARATLLPRGLNVLFGVALLGVARTSFFAHYWRHITLAVCIAVVANETAIAFVTHLYAPFEAALLLLFVGTGALIPWGLAWQSMLVIFGLGAFMGFYHFQPSHDPLMSHRFLSLLTAVGVALFSTSLGKGFRDALAQRIKMLHESQGRLNAEALERERIISEREVAERHARASEALLRKVFDATPDVLVVTRLSDGRFIAANRQFDHTGFSREEAMRSGEISRQRWLKSEDYRKCVDQLIRDGVVRNFETSFRNSDGTVTPTLVSGALIDINGEQCGVWLNRDITDITRARADLIQAREAALAASKSKSEFLSSMSHEMRTPLNAILGLADVLWDTELSDEQRQYLEVMQNNGNALRDLIDDVLDLAKVESGKLILEHAQFSLCDLLDGVLETFGVRACARNLVLSGRRDPAVPVMLVGDLMRLRQVLVNLISNAIKFTERGEVTLTVINGAGAGELHFAIADTGIGIAPDKLDAIFASFTQADSSTARRYGGSGLGLTIVKRLVALMGGRVWAESEPGKGSIFHFTVCFGVITESLPPPPPVKLDGIKAIVADRSANNRAALRALLEECGATVAEVAESPDIAGLRPREGDMVFVECRSSDSGELDRIAALARGVSGASVIALIPADKPHTLIPALQRLGVLYSLVKPVRRRDFVEKIGSALNVPGGGQTLPGNPALPAGTLWEPTAVGPKRILLAEDSVDNRLLFDVYLGGGDYLVDVAENGAVVFEKFVKGNFDVVLMDIQMPLVDGFAATRRIRQWEKDNGRPRTPIIALTASALDEDIRECYAAGCDAHLAKPTRKLEMLEAIRMSIERRRHAG